MPNFLVTCEVIMIIDSGRMLSLIEPIYIDYILNWRIINVKCPLDSSLIDLLTDYATLHAAVSVNNQGRIQRYSVAKQQV